jgi:AcrR family transcriptional regulator
LPTCVGNDASADLRYCQRVLTYRVGMAFTERSRPAREAVLAAAGRSFADLGYERTTVRGVAQDAGVDPSMVIRYFGSKKDLFAATLDPSALRVDLRLPDLATTAPGERGAALARHFVGLWEDEPTSTMLAVLLRSATTNPVAAARMQEVFAGQVVELMRTLHPEAHDVGPASGTLAAHVLGTALCRYVLAMGPLATMSREEVVDSMGPVLESILDA